MIGLYIIGAFVVLVAYGIFRGRRRMRFYESEGRAIFQDVYSGSLPQPIYQYRNSYGFPSFTIRFKTVNEKLRAEADGRNEKFKGSIGQLCKDAGGKKRPFDAARGVCFISQEELDAFVERVRKDMKSREQRKKGQSSPRD